MELGHRFIGSFVFAMMAIGVSGTNATVINVVNDTFSDGGRTNGSDPLDIAWFKNSAGQSISIINDAIIGDGNALAVDVPAFSGSTSHVVFGSFSTTSLGSETGDKFRFSFDVRFPVAAPPNGGSRGFRFGLYNVVSPPLADILTGDESGIDGDGYASFVDVFQTPGIINTAREASAPDGVLGGAGFFIDGVPIDEVGGATPTFTDTDVSHSFVYEIERISPILLGFTLSIDDFIVTGTDAFPAGFDTFNTMVFRGANGNLDYTLDNVKIQLLTFDVPEPTSIALFGIGLVGLGYMRRRRKRITAA